MTPRTMMRPSGLGTAFLIATILTLTPISVGSVATDNKLSIGLADASAADDDARTKPNKKRAKKRRQIRKKKARQSKRERRQRRQLIARCREQADMTDPDEIKKAIKECVEENESS